MVNIARTQSLDLCSIELAELLQNNVICMRPWGIMILNYVVHALHVAFQASSPESCSILLAIVASRS